MRAAADWDEEELRAESAAEVEEIIAEAQPGQTIEEEGAAALSAAGFGCRLELRRVRLEMRWC